eukprot:Polyplicarium_translucidae@DN3120_c0_g1_i2.p1
MRRAGVFVTSKHRGLSDMRCQSLRWPLLVVTCLVLWGWLLGVHEATPGAIATITREAWEVGSAPTWSLWGGPTSDTASVWTFKNPPPPRAPEDGDAPMRIIVARLIGNNMPPLQGDKQARYNLNYTVRNEMLPAVARCKARKCYLAARQSRRCPKTATVPGDPEITVACISRVWIINRLLDVDERDQIVTLLEEHEESYVELPIERHVALNAPNIPNYVININGGRNEGFFEAVALGALWTVSLDGNTFLTHEAWLSTTSALLQAEKSHSTFAFLPMYRILKPTVEDSWFNSSTEFDSMYNTPSMLSRQESQVSIRRNVPFVYDETDRTRKMGHASEKEYIGNRSTHL